MKYLTVCTQNAANEPVEMYFIDIENMYTLIKRTQNFIWFFAIIIFVVSLIFIHSLPRQQKKYKKNRNNVLYI